MANKYDLPSRRDFAVIGIWLLVCLAAGLMVYLMAAR